MADPKEAHLLSLKVMRLTKPSLVHNQGISCEPSDIALSGQGARNDISVSGVASLPQSFGSIFLGETFTSYVIAHNGSKEAVQNVQVKAELQTASQRVPLMDPDFVPRTTLPQGESVDSVVAHEVKEIGVHILVCTVAYTHMRSAGPGEAGAVEDRKFFRKFFKFSVNKPLDVKTKAYNLKNDIYLEAQIQNIMPIPMFLYSVTLQAAAFYNATDLNQLKATGDEKDDDTPKTTFGNLTYLNPQDSRQYLYRLSPKDANDAAIRTNMQIGKLDVSWRTNLGEQGRLQTSPLSRKPPPPRDIEVTVMAAPDEVRCGQGFTMSLRVKNWTAAAMKLSLLEEQVKAEPILLDGVSSAHLGTLDAGGTMDLSLDLIAVSTGVHFVSGVSLRDSVSGKTHPLLPLPSCFVIAVDQDAELGQSLGVIEEVASV